MHKLACNHFIDPQVNLVPTNGSEKSWTWAAIDFSEEESNLEKFAVRFKTEETAKDFKIAFDSFKDAAEPVNVPEVTLPNSPEVNRFGFGYKPSGETSPRDVLPKPATGFGFGVKPSDETSAGEILPKPASGFAFGLKKEVPKNETPMEMMQVTFALWQHYFDF